MQGPSETISISKNISIWQGDLETSTTAGELMTSQKLPGVEEERESREGSSSDSDQS